MFGFRLDNEFSAMSRQVYRESAVAKAEASRKLLLKECAASTDEVFVAGFERIPTEVPLILQSAFECIDALQRRLADLEMELAATNREVTELREWREARYGDY